MKADTKRRSTGKPARKTQCTKGEEPVPSAGPMKYDPAFCEALGKETLFEFAQRIGVPTESIVPWIESYPEFRDAVRRANSALAARLERRLRASTDEAEVAALVGHLEVLAPEDWGDQAMAGRWWFL